MECHVATDNIESRDTGAILLLGGPNVGKSSLFHALTRSRVTISNYPGTTVALTRGSLNGGGPAIYDAPGVYGLLPVTEDERIARDALLAPETDRVVLVLDAKNLRRGLAFALEVAEAGHPFIVALNMEDEAQALGLHIDHRVLSDRLGVPVIPTVANKGRGTEELLGLLEEAAVPEVRVEYPEALRQAAEAVEALLPGNLPGKRFLAFSFLAGGDAIPEKISSGLSAEAHDRIARIREELTARLDMPLRALLMRSRLAGAENLLTEAMRWERKARGALWRDRLGALAVHPVAGPFVLMGILYALYKFVGEFGAGTLVDLLEGRLFGEIIIPALARWTEALLPIPLLRDFLFGPYGVISMGLTYALALILPIVGTFFLAFSVLEDSGYLPRLTLLANRFFKTMGLNGKAVLPMVLGLGCDTMATMTARIMETWKERILVTLLLALGVPCSAQLGVLMGMLGGSSSTLVLIWAGVIAGVLFMVGFVAARLLPGESSDFLVEVPPIRAPQLSNVLVKTAARIEWYLREAVPLFLAGTVLLFILDRIGALAGIQVLAAPLVEGFLGLPREVTESFVVGFLRRDFGAAGLFTLAKSGALNPNQVLVSLVTITLFIPCVANLLIIVKERGVRVALAISAFVFPFAFLVGGALRWILRLAEVTL